MTTPTREFDSPSFRGLCFILTATLCICAGLSITGCAKDKDKAEGTEEEAAPNKKMQFIMPPFGQSPPDGQVELDPESIELLGPVEAEGSYVNVLSIFQKSTSCYGKLLAKAKDEYDADGVTEIVAEARERKIWRFYKKIVVKLSGQAYRLLDSKSGAECRTECAEECCGEKGEEGQGCGGDGGECGDTCEDED